MSDSLIANTRFFLDGEERLGADYDEEADVLYLWRGDAPAAGIAFTTDTGPIVRFDPATGDVVGFTIPDWAARWRARKRIEIRVDIPPHGISESEEEQAKTHRVLALVG